MADLNPDFNRYLQEKGPVDPCRTRKKGSNSDGCGAAGLGLVAAFAVIWTALYLVYRYNKKKVVVNSTRDAMDQRTSSSSSQVPRSSKFGKEVHQLNESVFELYTPSSKSTLQVLFFHGFQLGDNDDPHLSTWESWDGSCVWPGTWLREEFPSAHILSIAYNACLTKSKEDGSVDLFVIAENLMADLLEAKIGQDRRCPIVLVGHSFGGLVIKQLCLHARKKGNSEHSLFLENVKGMFFYSTPHRGIRSEKVASLFTGTSRLLENVELLSTSTARLNDDFEKLQGFYKDWHLAGVGEGCFTELGQFPAFMVVEEASSRYGHDFVIVPYANHITISRPLQKTSTSFLALNRFIDKVCKDPKVSGAIHHTQGLPDISSGLEKRVKDVKNMLEKRTSQATVLGIVGMGGIAKTTLAKRLFNDTSVEFEYTCFVDNVKSIPIHNLTDCLLSQFHCNGVRMDKMQWSYLKEKKTLIVMDDIDSEDQLKYLPHLHDIGGGSHLIVTSRDHDVSNFFSSYSQYDVEFLNADEAKELLCQHVFGLDKIPKYVMEKDDRLGECVDGVVLKCQGLALTLEVVGRYLRQQKDNVGFWNQTIKKLGEAKSVDGRANDRVWASLRISYDDLAPEEKEMFIDAGTCFFQESLDEAFAAWSGSNDCVESTWENLLRRSLVKVNHERIWVHEHLRDLAKKVSQRYMVSINDVNTLKKWDPYAAILMTSGYSQPARLDVWFAARVTKIEDRRGLDLDMARIESLLDASTLQLESLEHMENLKYLDLFDILPDGLSKNFPKNLSLLTWHLYGKGHPELPGISWTGMRNLGVLRLHGLKVSTEFLEALGNLTNLRILYLDDLEGLDSLPEEVGNLSCLQKLYLDNLKLSRLPDTFGDLGALEYLQLFNLEILELPRSFGGLHSLITLKILSCNKLGSLPEAFGDLFRLKELSFTECDSLESLPESFGLLASLEDLYINWRSKLKRLPKKFGQLKALQRLRIGNCSELEALSDSFGNLSALTHLELKKISILEDLPASFGKLSSLEELTLEGCSRLQRLPDNFGDLTSLKKLKIDGASNLEALSNSFGKLSSLTYLELLDFPSLEELPASFGQLVALERLTIDGAHHLQKLCDNFGSLSALTCIKLRDCPKLENLPLTFGLLHGLEELELSSCSRLQRLPETFGQLRTLKKLIIREADHLEELCGNFEFLSGLKNLELDKHSHFQQLLNTPGKLRVLKKLTLTIHEADHLADLCDYVGLRFMVETLVLTLKCWELRRLPDNLGQLTALTELSILRADHLEELPDYIAYISSLRKMRLHQCERLKNLPDNLGRPLSPELALPRADSASPSPIKSEGSNASKPKALSRVLHEGVHCDGCRMKPIEGTRFKSAKLPDYDLCPNCFEKADDQADYLRINQRVNINGLRVYIAECPFLDQSALARLGWMEYEEGNSLNGYIRFT